MISFVVAFNKNISYGSFFSNLSLNLKKFKNSEVIFVVQISQNKRIVNAIEKFEKENKHLEIKVIFSSKNISFDNQIFYAQKQITKKHVYLLNPSINLDKKFYQSINKVLAKNPDIDIIEFKQKFKGAFKFESKLRLDFKLVNTLIEIPKENSIIAFTFPIITNKIVSKKLITKLFNEIKNFDSKKDTSTPFSILLNYNILLNANSYYFINEQLITVDVPKNFGINHNDLIKEWDIIQQNYLQSNKYIQEMRYAKLFYLQVIIPVIYSNNKGHLLSKKTKTNPLQKKYYEKLQKIRKNEFEFFDVENKYMNISNSESNLLKQIIPINNWSKILSILEK